MTNLTDIIEEVEADLRNQPMAASEYDTDDIERFVKAAIRDLYVVTGRAEEYSSELYIKERGKVYLTATLKADEILYIILTAKMLMLEAIRRGVSEMVSYTTDALSVTGGDKPYKNLTGDIDELKQERRIVYHKMIRYTLEDIGVQECDIL